MDKTIYKIVFLNEDKTPITIYAEKIEPSSFLGLIEASGLIFIESSEIIITPEDDKIHKLFKETVKTFIPINMIIRIDEISKHKKPQIINIAKTDSN